MYTEFLILATLDTLCSFSRNSHSVLSYVSTSRHSLSDFSTRILFLLHKIHHSYTHTHIHANASILLVLDVRPQQSQGPGLTFFIVYVHICSRAPGKVLGPFPELPIPQYYNNYYYYTK